MRTCQKCGNTIVHGQKICDVCGEYIFDTSENNQQAYQRTPPHIPDKPRMIEPERYVPEDDMTPTQFRLGLVAIIAIAVTILVGGTILALIFFAH